MIIAGTGHRAYQKDKKTDKWISKLEYPGAKGNSVELFSRLVQLSDAWLEAHPEVHTVISGAALGWDLALAKSALNKGRELHMYIPYKGHGESWNSFYRDVHREMVRKADFIHAPDVPFSVRSLLKRNEDMVDNSDLILALWDGSPGGTGSCITYAEKVKKPVVNLWNSWQKYKEI